MLGNLPKATKLEPKLRFEVLLFNLKATALLHSPGSLCRSLLVASLAPHSLWKTLYAFCLLWELMESFQLSPYSPDTTLSLVCKEIPQILTGEREKKSRASTSQTQSAKAFQNKSRCTSINQSINQHVWAPNFLYSKNNVGLYLLDVPEPLKCFPVYSLL